MRSPETHITLPLPGDIAAHLAAQGDLSRAALEGLAHEAFRQGKLSTGQLRRLLGLRTSLQIHAFLKQHDLYLTYSLEDLEHARQAGDALVPASVGLT